MKLGRLILLAGAALAANQFLKTEKGKQFKKDVAGKAGEWKDKLNDLITEKTGRSSGTDSNPTGSSFTGGTGTPL